MAFTPVSLGSAIKVRGRDIYFCLSTDVKTTSGIEARSVCHETDTGDWYEFSGGSWVQTHSNGAAHVRVTDTIITPAYYTGTIDTSATNSVVIPDTIQYSSMIVRLSGIAGAAVINITGDVTELQTGVYSTSLAMLSVALAETNTAGWITDVVNGTYRRNLGMNFTQIKLTVGGTPAAGTCTYYVILK